jgi:hypothetical protein
MLLNYLYLQPSEPNYLFSFVKNEFYLRYLIRNLLSLSYILSNYLYLQPSEPNYLFSFVKNEFF